MGIAACKSSGLGLGDAPLSAGIPYREDHDSPFPLSAVLACRRERCFYKKKTRFRAAFFFELAVSSRRERYFAKDILADFEGLSAAILASYTLNFKLCLALGACMPGKIC